MAQSKLFAFDTAHLTGTKLRHAVTVLRKCRCLWCQISLHSAILCLGAGADKRLAAHSRRQSCRLDRITDIIRLQPHIIAGIANRCRPPEMIEHIAGRNVGHVQIAKSRKITLHKMDMRILRNPCRSRRMRTDNGIDFNILCNTFPNQCGADGSGRSGHYNPFHLLSAFLLFIVLLYRRDQKVGKHFLPWKERCQILQRRTHKTAILQTLCCALRLEVLCR